MTVSDEDRRDLFEVLENLIGGKSANTMMELLPPVGWSDVARRGDLAELRAELRAEIAELRAEVHSLLPRLIAANMASMIGVAGLVLAAVAIG